MAENGAGPSKKTKIWRCSLLDHFSRSGTSPSASVSVISNDEIPLDGSFEVSGELGTV